MPTPPPEVLAEFMASTTRHTRRIEIYEQDGTTRWEKDTSSRLKEGAVTVDYSRDERRALDLVLSNADGVLMNAPGEFWYDKIIKVFRGVQIDRPSANPRILVLSDRTDTALAMAPSFRTAVLAVDAATFGDIQINPLVSSYDLDVRPFDIIVSMGDNNNSATLTEAYNAGKSVFIFGPQCDFFLDALYGADVWPGQTFTTTESGEMYSPRGGSDPRTMGWGPFEGIHRAGASYRAPAASWTEADGIASVIGNDDYLAISAITNDNDGKAVMVHFPLTAYQFMEQNFQAMIHTELHWLNPVNPVGHWETQIGEFMVDRISEPHFPYQMTITGRDYSKKCMLSKFSRATQFSEGNSLESVIAAIAIGAGILKRSLPTTGVTVNRAFFFDRGVSRWEAMKEITTAYNYEIFFDATGYLVIRPFSDPSTTPPAVYIRAGETLASYEKTTSDASIFNHILVTGESSDAEVVPVWAEARNENENSPTSIQELGDRYDEVVSAFIETQAQAQALANARLAVSQLEEFELNFESLMLPWLEVGVILGWEDPRPAPGDPTRFLLSSLSIPLTLGPMSGSGRRVTIVS